MLSELASWSNPEKSRHKWSFVGLLIIVFMVTSRKTQILVRLPTECPRCPRSRKVKKSQSSRCKKICKPIHKPAVGTKHIFDIKNVIPEMSNSRNFSMKASQKVIKVYKVEKRQYRNGNFPNDPDSSRLKLNLQVALFLKKM